MWASLACPVHPGAPQRTQWGCTARHFVPTCSGTVAEQQHQLPHWPFKHRYCQGVACCVLQGGHVVT